MRITHMRFTGLTGSALMLIAIVTMTIDHIGAVFIEQGLLKAYDYDMMLQFIATDTGRRIYILDLICRMIGRLAFPIFCFLLVEGFTYTRDRKRYLLQLLLFALVSELPFDLSMFRTWFYMDYQNVFFTLAIGIVVMMGLEQYRSNLPLKVLTVALGCVAAYLLKTDYHVVGILLITFFYLFRGREKARNISTGFLTVTESIGFFGTAVLSLIPIHYYNGKRGVLRSKYFFYLYYPVHLLILYLLRRFVFQI